MNESPHPAGPKRRPGRLGVGVLGPGRVGAVLASGLRSVGHEVVGVSTASENSRDRVDALLPGVPMIEPRDVVERAELVLVTVPDDVIAEVVDGLAELGAWQPGQLVVHCAGRFGTSVLEPARKAGAIPMALHPAMTFTGTSVDLPNLVDTAFAVTAPSPVLPIAQALVVELGGDPMVIAEEHRALYHAAMSHAANHAAVLIAQASQLLSIAGVTNPGQALSHLVQASVDYAWRSGENAVNSMTGPVVRGDVETVHAHLTALEATAASHPDTLDTLHAYRALAKATAERAAVIGRIQPSTAARLLELLDDDGLNTGGIRDGN